MPTGWAKLRKQTLQKNGGRCVWCQAPATDADHVKPHWEGGTDHLYNLQPMCHPCHLEKTKIDNRRKWGK